MSLVKCTECQGMLSSKAKQCPRCGAPVPNKSVRIPTSIGCLIIVAFIVAMAMYSTDTKPEKNSKPKASKAVRAVKATLRPNIVIRNYQQGKLNNGIAVLADDAAYWVKGGNVYAANGMARMCSPGIQLAPVGIDYGSVEDAIEGRSTAYAERRVKTQNPKPGAPVRIGPIYRLSKRTALLQTKSSSNRLFVKNLKEGPLPTSSWVEMYISPGTEITVFAIHQVNGEDWYLAAAQVEPEPNPKAEIGWIRDSELTGQKLEIVPD